MVGPEQPNPVCYILFPIILSHLVSAHNNLPIPQPMRYPTECTVEGADEGPPPHRQRCSEEEPVAAEWTLNLQRKPFLLRGGAGPGGGDSSPSTKAIPRHSTPARMRLSPPHPTTRASTRGTCSASSPSPVELHRLTLSTAHLSYPDLRSRTNSTLLTAKL